MMISPETFYEFELKGKTAEQIMTTIRSLKRSISRNKRDIENRLTGGQPSREMRDPSPEVFIFMEREYLQRAIQAYNEAGGTYKYSRAETAAMEFDENLEHIYGIRFEIGGFFEGFTIRTIAVVGDQLLTGVSHTPGSDESCKSEIGNLEDFPILFQRLHIGEWKRCYRDPGVMDGTEWTLEIFYNNGRPKFECCGSNAYPYNFDELCDLFGAHEYKSAYRDAEEDEEDEEES